MKKVIAVFLIGLAGCEKTEPPKSAFQQAVDASIEAEIAVRSLSLEQRAAYTNASQYISPTLLDPVRANWPADTVVSELILDDGERKCWHVRGKVFYPNIDNETLENIWAVTLVDHATKFGSYVVLEVKLGDEVIWHDANY